MNKIEDVLVELNKKIESLERENKKLRNFSKSPKEKFYTINEETGDEYTASELEKESRAMQQLARQLKRKERENLIVIEEESTTVNIKNTRHERRFVKMYYVSLRNLTEELDVNSLGLLQKLIQHLRIDGTNGLIGETAKKYWYKKVGMSKNGFNKHFDILKEYDLVKFIRNKGIFLNPYYVRYGNEVEKSTLDLFNLVYDKNTGLSKKT